MSSRTTVLFGWEAMHPQLRNDKYIMMQNTNWINSTPSQQQLLSCLAQWLEHLVYNRGVANTFESHHRQKLIFSA